MAYAFCTMSKLECNYAITNKEVLALICTIKHFRPYLHGSYFIVEMDCTPLKALQTSCELTMRLAWWALILQSYDCIIMYKSGRSYGNADALTRSMPMEPEPYSKFQDIQEKIEGLDKNRIEMINFVPLVKF